MDQQRNISIKQDDKMDIGYLVLNISVLFIFPILSTVIEHLVDNVEYSWLLIGKWFVFWSIGIRLFIAGIKQASDPEFTATRIFKFKNRESYTVIRELGFANLALGAMGILSALNEEWRLMAAIIGGLYIGFAGLQHGFKGPETANEWIAFVYDVIVFVGMFFVLFHH